MYQTTVTLAFAGPPSVRILTESKSWKFQIVAITTAKKNVGRISGSQGAALLDQCDKLRCRSQFHRFAIPGKPRVACRILRGGDQCAGTVDTQRRAFYGTISLHDLQGERSVRNEQAPRAQVVTLGALMNDGRQRKRCKRNSGALLGTEAILQRRAVESGDETQSP